MKSLKFGTVLALVLLLIACGSDHPRLMGVSVSPATASVSMGATMIGTMGGGSMATVTFTAMGHFNNNTTRMLSRADGLTWTSSNSMIASIDMNGVARCVSAGTVRIVASVPVSSSIMTSMNMQMSASTMTGTATLTCM